MAIEAIRKRLNRELSQLKSGDVDGALAMAKKIIAAGLWNPDVAKLIRQTAAVSDQTATKYARGIGSLTRALSIDY